MNYFDLPEVSNSDLTALARACKGVPDNRDELEDIFNFGSLVDAMLTEDHKVGYKTRTLLQDDGSLLFYTEVIFAQAEKLADNLRKDPLVSQFLRVMKGQYVFVRSLRFIYHDEEYVIRARCKFDGYAKLFKTGLDYKTTACTSQKQFNAAIDFFHWDRQAAFYMDLAGIDRHWIIGISKKNGKVFKFAIQRGDEVYNRGRSKYAFWAYRWLILLENFKPQLSA